MPNRCCTWQQNIQRPPHAVDEKNEYKEEKKWLDEEPFSAWFNIRCWLLRKPGLNGYSFLAFMIGVAFTLILLQLF